MSNDQPATGVVSRRGALKGLGAAGAASAVVAGGLVGAGPASAAPARLLPAVPLPKPVGARVPTGFTAPQPEEIAFTLPGPPGAATPVIGLPAMGLDIDPSSISDFNGFTAFAVVAGEARASDGNLYPFEFDVRAMKGTYVGEDGTEQRGEFAFM
ncbi:MAG: hypothetical protein AAF531_26385 [Actinomycetota bacterium]